ncbi:serine/threonine-protein kinase [Streptomyces sp. Je 1-4]|uniref:serine/threonine-protein kinase n=1 Tax=Streptomyces TaxID=1883 RepID=UPI0021D9E140|nr:MULTISPECIES: serine/threonine-protein kinase [unclassified Streptomyces]UYB43780.1 serine/threonine-protein kinase [Streptomyces sp. Je 1-4]UZQ40188.1 serine/threonine-protein kinase [Streptomyces sp. Je 1-4] [Streptomyces sp. Je 1-4 4N24]UZQ47605.1 serine/threonine-protein kinase [Streptomyces sp. Je 1-4] [Streptomyces sp. Je 1-4 4N24_ara]
MAENRLIQRRYRLLDTIGRGGMGEVWRARDESLGRQVAVKCLKPLGPRHEPSFLQVLRERFRREARVAAALQHRGITVVHDFGEDDGTLFIVMELLSGRNLSQLLDDNRRQPLPVPDVIEIAEQVTAALAYTHEQAIVHRDLKPANIVRTADGTVKICDFGIARLGHDIGFTARLTGTGIAMGSPHYMSPEQIGAHGIDHRSDLYSFGCVLYEIATGVPPFDLGDAWAVLVGHRDLAPKPPRTLRPDLPEAYERIMLELLAKDPDDRPRDADELGKRLVDARRSHSGRGTAAAGPEEVTVPAWQLPPWTDGMTFGSPAGATRRPQRYPDDGGATVLTGTWTGGTDPRGGGASPAAGIASPAPPDDRRAALAELAGRHTAALDLGRLGRWEEAGEAHRALAADRERLLGPDHPDTLTSRLEAGHALGRLGRHFEAHQIYAEVLAGRERALGPDHPDSLSCRHHVAGNLGRLGRLEDSRAMAQEVAAARARVLGAQHPDTLATYCELAYVLGKLGQWADALHTYQGVAAARTATLGPAHDDTLAARYEVGIGLGRLGRSAEALALYRDLVADRTRAQGADDPETLRARHGLVVNLGRQNRWQEALVEAREVAAARARVLGPEHPDTLVSRRETAVALGWLGRWSEALDLYRQVADARERVLGAAHLDALASQGDLAQCLEQLGRGDEAAALHRRVAALHQERAVRRP